MPIPTPEFNVQPLSPSALLAAQQKERERGGGLGSMEGMFRFLAQSGLFSRGPGVPEPDFSTERSMDLDSPIMQAFLGGPQPLQGISQKIGP